MPPRLSHHSAQWLNLRVEHRLSKHEGEDVFIDLTLASSLLPVDLSCRHMMALCEKSVLPVYRGLMGVLERDIDHVSRLLSELDPLIDETEGHPRSECPVLDSEPQGSPSIEPAFTPQSLRSSDPVNPERPKRKRWRSSTLQEPIVIRPSDTFAPTIIITPCPPQTRETSCWVPYQDASFGTRLTVPTYNPLNSVHPPMVDPTNTVVMQTDHWEYDRGHWRAVIPPLDEQCKRGMFSRVVLPRRKPRRPPYRIGDSFL